MAKSSCKPEWMSAMLPSSLRENFISQLVARAELMIDGHRANMITTADNLLLLLLDRLKLYILYCILLLVEPLNFSIQEQTLTK